jgi:hypothetical protein
MAHMRVGPQNFADPAVRRRFYLERGLRRRPIGAGSDLDMLMQLERTRLFVTMESLFGEITVAVVGGVATRAYAPERVTQDLDILVGRDDYDDAVQRLESTGWHRLRELGFPNTMLGLYGTAWTKDGYKLDLMATGLPWGDEALAEEAFDQTGLRIVAMPYLVLMKVDSARGIDQGDLTRMLGRASAEDVERTVRIVERHHGDPHAAEDVRQYAELGALEYIKPERGEPY